MANLNANSAVSSLFLLSAPQYDLILSFNEALNSTFPGPGRISFRVTLLSSRKGLARLPSLCSFEAATFSFSHAPTFFSLVLSMQGVPGSQSNRIPASVTGTWGKYMPQPVSLQARSSCLGLFHCCHRMAKATILLFACFSRWHLTKGVQHIEQQMLPTSSPSLSLFSNPRLHSQ